MSTSKSIRQRQHQGFSFHVVHSSLTIPRYTTCNNVIHWAPSLQHLLDEAHLSAHLQVPNTFSEDGGEHSPDFSLAGDVAVLQQLHHAADTPHILDNEVCLQIKLAPHQLKSEMRRRAKMSSFCHSPAVPVRRTLACSWIFQVGTAFNQWLKLSSIHWPPTWTTL